MSNCPFTFEMVWILEHSVQTVGTPFTEPGHWTLIKPSVQFTNYPDTFLICPDNFLPVRNFSDCPGTFQFVRIFFRLCGYFFLLYIFTFSNTIIAITVKTLRVAMLTISFGPELNGWLYVQKREVTF